MEVELVELVPEASLFKAFLRKEWVFSNLWEIVVSVYTQLFYLCTERIYLVIISNSS